MLKALEQLGGQSCGEALTGSFRSLGYTRAPSALIYLAAAVKRDFFDLPTGQSYRSTGSKGQYRGTDENPCVPA